MACFNPFRPSWVRDGQHYYIREKCGSGAYWAVYRCDPTDDVRIKRWADVDDTAKNNARKMVNELNGWYKRDKINIQ